MECPHDRVRTIHNGIDLSEYKPTPDQAVLAKHGIDPEKPFVLFVGRITRQKGIIHLVDAVKYIRPGVQVVLCAGAPDTKEIGREMAERVEQARRDAAAPIIWIRPDASQRGYHPPLHACLGLRLPVRL